MGDFSDSFDVETAYDWAINIVFMSDELTKYGMVTGIILGVFDTTDLGVEPLDILRLVATNEYLHYPYNKTLQSEDFEMALYVILSETSPENFEWKMKNEDESTEYEMKSKRPCAHPRATRSVSRNERTEEMKKMKEIMEKNIMKNNGVLCFWSVERK